MRAESSGNTILEVMANRSQHTMFTEKILLLINRDGKSYEYCLINNNNNIPYLYRITFSVKVLLLSLRVLLKLKFVK